MFVNTRDVVCELWCRDGFDSCVTGEAVYSFAVANMTFIEFTMICVMYMSCFKKKRTNK